MRNWLNKRLQKQHRLCTQNNGRFYEIVYCKGCFSQDEKISIKRLFQKLRINHWEVNEVIGITDTYDLIRGKQGSTLNCMGYGYGVIYGFFVKKLMRKQLEQTAEAWSKLNSR